MEETNNSQPANRVDTGRNEDGTFKAGFSGNPSGRPKGTMKDYLSRKFSAMSDEDKEQFLLTHKVSGKDQIEFGEGKAKQGLDIDATISGPSLIRLDE